MTLKGIIWLLLVLGGPCSFAQSCLSPQVGAITVREAERSAILPERQERIQNSLATHRYDVITLGDSIMQLWEEPRLEDIFGSSVLNSGFGQDGTQHVLWRLRTTNWHSQSPRQVLLLVGTNDIAQPACNIYWGIRTVVSRSHGIFPGAHVLVMGLLPRGTDLLEHDDKIRAVNMELKERSGEGKFSFFDPHDAFLCGHHTPCALFQPNNLHLTKEGYDLLDDLLKRFLKSNDLGS